MCNTVLTKDAFWGKPAINFTYKHIKDKDEKIIGGVNANAICDLNGHRIARFVAVDTVLLENDVEVEARIYESRFGEFQVYNRKVYLNGVEIGRIDLVWLLPFIIVPTVALIIVLACMISLFITKPWLPESDRPVIDISDKDGKWKDGINVFGEGVKPGEEGNYKFEIANNQKTGMYYYISLDEIYNGKVVDDFPIEFKLTGKGVAVTRHWYSSEEIEYFKIYLEPGESTECTLKWRWLFESGDDATDTKYGSDNGDYKIDITVTAVAKE